MARLYFGAMNRLRPLVLICLACLALFLVACGNRGPLVLPEDAPPPMPAPAPTSAPAPAGTADGIEGEREDSPR
jgi:predicted small lipoprotein YifL